MARLPLTTISVCLLMAVVEPQSFTIQAEHSRINASVGETAYFSVKPSRPMQNGEWDFNGKRIGRWIGSSVSIQNEYKSRAEILLPNGSLLLKSLKSSDSGKYTVTMVPAVGGPASATLTLHVIELQIQTEHSWINVSIGETALFSVNPSLTVKTGNWDFNGKNIGLWIGSSVSLSEQYESRAEILLPNGSLLLKSLTSSDSGKYTVNMVSEVGGPASATLTLHVFVPLIQTEHRWINMSVGETALFSVKPSAAVKNGQWNFNGMNIALWINTSVFLSSEYQSRAEILLPNGSLLLKSVTILDSGEYTVIMVPEVGNQASATLNLHVLDQLNSGNNISDGAIAGIVIAALLCLGFIIAISAWLIKRKSEGMKSPKQGQNTSSVENDHSAAPSEIYENIPNKKRLVQLL
ncbi:muscle M-line assembly protein unc-89-like [Rhincodon typus]|uniref:muscle M-line assembly protein unc-89-like n=1 Tax=Rhincodon typus TaxID=259920 RepID=UPI00202F2921|nr:muscle M-line assembly protein unc-89-like [Rhincodon typus]